MPLRWGATLGFLIAALWACGTSATIEESGSPNVVAASGASSSRSATTPAANPRSNATPAYILVSQLQVPTETVPTTAEISQQGESRTQNVDETIFRNPDTGSPLATQVTPPSATEVAPSLSPSVVSMYQTALPSIAPRPLATSTATPPNTTYTPTATATPHPAQYTTAMPTSTPPLTSTAIQAATSVLAPTPTATLTQAPSPSPTFAPTTTATPTATATPPPALHTSATSIPTPHHISTATQGPESVLTPTPIASPTQARSPSPTPVPTATATPTPTFTAIPTPSHTPVPEHCRIKGNINMESGERVYHTPNSPWYARTEIDTHAGERWFCTEREAQEAGWRAPQTAQAKLTSTAVQNAPSAICETIINVNTADSGQLETLPGIGSVKAQAIVDYRNANGNFSRIEDLDNVKGIGVKTLEKISPCVVLR